MDTWQERIKNIANHSDTFGNASDFEELMAIGREMKSLQEENTALKGKEKYFTLKSLKYASMWAELCIIHMESKEDSEAKLSKAVEWLKHLEKSTNIEGEDVEKFDNFLRGCYNHLFEFG